MALNDALRLIAAEWDDVEALLTVPQLARIAGYDSDDLLSEGQLFEAISAVLPRDHRAWDELRKQPVRRQESSLSPIFGPDPASRIARSARRALLSQQVADDAAADAIVEQVRRNVLAFGYTVQQLDHASPSGLLGVPVAKGIAYPAFQFAAGNEPEPHPAFVNVNEILGADFDSLGALSWWMSPNLWLQAIPAFLLGSEREAELEYAAQQLYSDSW